MQHKQNEFLWVEKYRPQTIQDCILPVSLKKSFEDMVAKGEPQNLLLAGSAGTGKTTVARALCNDIGVDHIIINCSENGNIDTLRTDIRQFASTVSLSESKKAVILDEFDYSNAQSIQPALRGAIEEFSNNCRFIITCNYKNRIIQPIHSRCTCIDFTIGSTDKPEIAKLLLSRCEYILDNEKVKYDKKSLSQLIIKHFPDFRRIINELQRYSASGIIDAGILANLKDIEIKTLVSSMKIKDFSGVRKWVVNNLDNSQTELFRKIYDCLYDTLVPSSVPEAVLVLAEYQYKSGFVADQEINTVACLVELMMRCEFK
jgi:DNA polymerase III delta prime subunit